MSYQRVSGVNGWLAFLVTALTVLGPAFNIIGTLSIIGMAQSQHPGASASLVWQHTRAAILTLMVLQVAISIGAGVLLARRFRPSTPAIVIGALWIGGPVLTLAGSLAVGMIAGVDAAGSGGDLVRSCVTAAIWTAYLLKSSRVENTYHGVRSSDELIGEVFR